MLSPFGGGCFGLMCWKREVIWNRNSSASPFNSPSGGGYWMPINCYKRKHFLLYSKFLSTTLSPFGGGCFGLEWLGGRLSGIEIHLLPPLSPPLGGYLAPGNFTQEEYFSNLLQSRFQLFPFSFQLFFWSKGLLRREVPGGGPKLSIQ